MARRPSTDIPDAALHAIEALGGAAIVLDEALRIVAATPLAVELLGFEPPRGERATAVLCGASAQKLVADALATGDIVRAVVPHPGRTDDSGLLVRALPWRDAAGQPGAWVLLLESHEASGADGAVEFQGMVTGAAVMKDLFAVLERVARTDAPVLVRGETGAGKELVATAIHRLSRRSSGPFRAINCAALPAALLESELFGHVRGAFTGAVRDRQGHFELAHGGTLFLDEVAEIPLELQAKLLRVLESGQITPVGGRSPITVDVRIVSATHRALRREAEAGRFRADLMYRLRVIPVRLPPLRDRGGDIRVLVPRFLAELNEHGDRRIEGVSPEAMALLEAWPYPGNVRELRNVLFYAYAIGTGPVLQADELPPEMREGADPLEPTGAPPAAALPPLPPVSVGRRAELAPEAERIAVALERAGGSRERAATLLGISRVTLWRRMKELGLTSSD